VEILYRCRFYVQIETSDLNSTSTYTYMPIHTCNRFHTFQSKILSPQNHYLRNIYCVRVYCVVINFEVKVFELKCENGYMCVYAYRCKLT
jgi:hypothetical protein